MRSEGCSGRAGSARSSRRCTTSRAAGGAEAAAPAPDDHRADHRALPDGGAAMARIRHDGIVQVLDAGKDPDGTVYIALELLDGESLETTLQRVRTSPGARPRASASTCSRRSPRRTGTRSSTGTSSPGTSSSSARTTASSQAKLLDFGIAHVAQRGQEAHPAGDDPRHAGVHVPRAGAGGINVGPESDLWSVGIVLFECVTGSTPFVSENTTEILLKVQTERAPELSSIPVGARGDLGGGPPRPGARGLGAVSQRRRDARGAAARGVGL
jgi:serine/threonine protein kinase